MDNFHNFIALPLENEARKLLSISDRPVGKIFDADSIEAGYFVEVMITLLHIKNNYAIDPSIKEFILKYRNYSMVSGNAIEESIAREMYSEFENLLNANLE